jgi:hypothetical protein
MQRPPKISSRAKKKMPNFERGHPKAPRLQILLLTLDAVAKKL